VTQEGLAPTHENPTHEPEFDVLARETVYLITGSDQSSVGALEGIGRDMETRDPEAPVHPGLRGLRYAENPSLFDQNVFSGHYPLLVAMSS
jgi:hypothetical protein